MGDQLTPALGPTQVASKPTRQGSTDTGFSPDPICQNTTRRDSSQTKKDNSRPAPGRPVGKKMQVVTTRGFPLVAGREPGCPGPLPSGHLTLATTAARRSARRSTSSRLASVPAVPAPSTLTERRSAFSRRNATPLSVRMRSRAIPTKCGA